MAKRIEQIQNITEILGKYLHIINLRKMSNVYKELL